MRDSFIFYRSFFESAKDLSSKEKLKLYEAIFRLALYNEDSELTGFAKSLFLFIKNQIIANNVRYENGKKGGRKKTNINATKKQPMVFLNDDKKTTKKQPMVFLEREQRNEETEEKESNKEKEVKEVKKIEKDIISPLISSYEDIVPPNGETNKKNENIELDDFEIIPNEEKEKEKSSAKKEKEVRHKYGPYRNVLLSDEEYFKLTDMPDGEKIIDFFSEMKEMKGYSYKRDYLAIKKWGIRAYEELSANNQQHPGQYPRNTIGTDADIKRRERENLNQIALAILSSPPPEKHRGFD